MFNLVNFTRTVFNPKRQLRAIPPSAEELTQLNCLAEKVKYGGNPEHKRNPGDYGLTPPANPRRGKTLCDSAAIFKKAEALELLRLGLRSGLVSKTEIQGWPKNIWIVTPEGVPLEAQWENLGVYHGYPIPENDPFREEVLHAWSITQIV